MKTWFPLGLSLAALVLAGFSLILRQEARGPLSAPVETAASADLSEVRAQLDTIEGRLRTVELRAQRPASVASTPGAPSPATPETAIAPGESPSPASIPGEKPAAPPRNLAAALSDEESFREYLFGVIEEERNQQQARAREQAEQRRLEWEELRKGPYGQYNMKVNSMAKALTMNQSQKDSYHQLLTQYADRFSELTKDTNWRDPQAVTTYQEKQKTLQEDFDADVVRLLTPQQGEDYLKLPQWQRQPTGGAVVTSFSTDGQAVDVRFGGGGVGASVSPGG